jgi:sterol desaturase/sphingolipid hydroxylase (fatty acid hydroxylase superfamily)
VVHHSSEKLNLSTAFRQSFTYPVSGMWLFWLPMPIIGFSPEMVVTMVILSLAYQFFIHTRTQLVKKLGKWEVAPNTSHHRVRHGKNPDHIDKNYGGTLIIWDRLFGTFAEERGDTPVIYGITRQINSHNPLLLTLHEWRDMANDAFAPGKSLGQRLKHVFGPPEWTETEAVTAAREVRRPGAVPYDRTHPSPVPCQV